MTDFRTGIAGTPPPPKLSDCRSFSPCIYTLTMTVVVASGGSRRTEPFCNRLPNDQLPVFRKAGLSPSAALVASSSCQQISHQ